MKKLQQRIKKIYTLRKFITTLLLLSFFFVALHSSVHSPDDHIHDNKCDIYVLEELFSSADILYVAAAFFLFTPYIFLVFLPRATTLRVEKHFAIRAPPLF